MDVIPNDFHHIPQRGFILTSRFRSLYELQQVGQLCDVELVTNNGCQIPTHRVVLAACSPYFRAMFAGSLSESAQPSISVVDFDSDVVEAVVKYSYNADFTLPADRVMVLIVAADYYQIAPLYDKCLHYLEKNLNPSNCLALKTLARLHGFSHLFKACTKFACDNFEVAIACEEFVNIPCEDLEDLISRDEVEVACEEKVYSAIIRWVYHDLDSRKDLVPQIMAFVRLPLVSPLFFSRVVEMETLLTQDDRCKFYIHEASTYIKSPYKRHQLKDSPRIQPRKPFGLEDVILTIGDNGHRVEQYDDETDSWTDLGPCEVDHFDFPACFHNGYLYAIGGFIDTWDPHQDAVYEEDTEFYFNSVHRYHVKENKWTQVAPMLQYRKYHAAHLLYGLIYVTGGANSKGTLRSAECYNPDTDHWVNIRSMIQPRRGHGMAEVDGFIYTVAGDNLSDDCVHSETFCSVERYDPSEDAWTFVSSLSVPRTNLGVAALRGSIYAVGGVDAELGNLNDVERYDVEVNQWFPCPPTIEARSSLGVVAYNGELYACGGYGPDLDSMERFSPATQSWELCYEKLNSVKYQFGIATTFKQCSHVATVAMDS